MNSPIANKGMNDNVCVKCRSCGLPWNRKLQRRKKQCQSRAYLHCQLCSILIQSCVRRYLIRRHHRNNDPVEKWNRGCVHYLSRRTPYGAKHHVAAYQRTICRSAAIEIQKFWRNHRCLKHLQRLSSKAKEMNSITIQRVWRESWCRRSFRTVCRAIRQREKLFYSLIDSGDIEGKQISFCLSRGCPFAIEYKQQSSNAWEEVDRNKFRLYICQQLNARHKRKKMSNLSPIPRKSAAELKRDKIRKLSRNKWKWFYDKQDCCENNSAFSRQPKVVEVDDVSSDSDMMVWVTNLNLNGCCIDD